MDSKQVILNYEVPDTIRIEKVIAFIRRHFKEIKNLDILECGITRGGVADILSREGANCFGIDISPRKLDGIKIIEKDLNDGFPEFKSKFDIIFAGELIEHMFDDIKFIKGCRENLKSGGLLIITTPNLMFTVSRFLMLLGNMPLFSVGLGHYNVYNKKTIENLIKREGFEILKTSSTHVLASTRRNKFYRIFEVLGDFFPSFGAHLIVFAKKV